LKIIVFVGVLYCFGFIPARLAIAHYFAPQPQVIFVLGGAPEREKTAAQLAKYYPDLDIWISTGERPESARSIFESADVSTDRLRLDYRATDTVTNFTTLVSEFRHRRIQHLYLVTSDFHMPRSIAIATIVLGSQGIYFTPIAVPSEQPKEPVLQIARDVVRSIFWIFTGHTGSNLKTWR
jgi:uncharacterized SAM-binding protein YcdF (DUF218 family)